MAIKRCSCLLITIAMLLTLAGCVSSGAVEDKADDEASATINARLGLAYMQQGDYETALEKLEKALEQDPKQAIVHHYLAELHRQLNSMDEAEKYYKNALKLTSDDYSLHNNFGVFLCDRKDFDGAERSFLMAVQTAPVHKPRYEFYENLAQCMMRKPDWEKAEKYFRIALDGNPRLPLSLYQMARLSYENKKYLRARAFFQRFVELSTHTAETLWLGVQIERELGGFKVADEYARQLKVNFPLSNETAKLMESEQP